MAAPDPVSAVELVRTVYDDLDAGDVESVLAAMAPGVEWVEQEGERFGGPYRGRDAVAEHVLPALAGGESSEVHPVRFVDGDDTIVVLGAVRTRTDEGDRVDTRFAHVVHVHDGRVVRIEAYAGTPARR